MNLRKPKDVLTNKQLRRFEERKVRLNNEALAALKTLTFAPEVKDMITKIKLGEFPCGRAYGSWSELWLKKEGLVEKSGYSGRCTCIDHTFGCVSESYENAPKIVESSIELVEKYNLSKKQLTQILIKLKD